MASAEVQKQKQIQFGASKSFMIPSQNLKIR